MSVLHDNHFAMEEERVLESVMNYIFEYGSESDPTPIDQVNEDPVIEEMEKMMMKRREKEEKDLALVHSLNTVAVLVTSPTYTHVMHRFYVPLLERCVGFLDSSEYVLHVIVLMIMIDNADSIDD